MNMDEILSTMESLKKSGSKLPGFRGKIMVDADKLTEVYDQIKSGLPNNFEEAFANRMQAKHAISVSSCTAGLHLSLFVNEIGPGDAVALPAMTHVATSHVIELQDAKPIFIDVDPLTGNMNCQKLLETGICLVIRYPYCQLSTLRKVR